MPAAIAGISKRPDGSQATSASPETPEPSNPPTFEPTRTLTPLIGCAKSAGAISRPATCPTGASAIVAFPSPSIPYAAMSETSSNCWKLSVINEASCWEYLVDKPSRTSWMAA